MPGSEFELRADDGQRLLARRWLPEGRPRAIVEDRTRPRRAQRPLRPPRRPAQRRGYGAYAADLRGHGPKAAAADLGHFADQDGWAKCVGDLWT